ncbi:adenosine kinase [Candidatus Phycosocius spiralis]|uniref:Adenosine kinase n=1 Tax=Candidatus Phycosocius spiralis TaxID=2815099 RepID=A0ABQ4PTL3_9PROT|nr:adenosine kinase [Candidatus Phycosocius spiralis]GIU66328.1 adenosine kinase [Candidatus Phycosocius spiralis]
MPTSFDVCGIGNAIVDVIAPATEAFLAEHGIAKGAMTLIFDEPMVEKLYASMAPGQETSGGSAANTLAGIASLGGKGAYIGKVADDQLGKVFRHDLNAGGVAYDTPPFTHGPSTARCMINVTPDGQRSMSTYLGCSILLSPEDLDTVKITNAQIVFLEGYLFDADEAKTAFIEASKLAHNAGRKVALTLSDLFCVNRHRSAFADLVAHHIDILFANEEEIKALYEVADFDAALAAARKDCGLIALTRSEKGSVLARGDEIVSVDAEPVSAVIDTTGAGDLYAAGVLFGLATGRSLEVCGKLGSLAAAEIISHFGARPQTSLAALAAAKGL